MTTIGAKKILIIDNDPAVVRALAKRIESLGYECIAAGSGTQGLAQFNRGGIDLVITDLNMPEGDGVNLAESIRQASRVPIIFITGFKDEFKRRLRHLRNVTVIRKPFATESMVELIETELSLARPKAASRPTNTIKEPA